MNVLTIIFCLLPYSRTQFLSDNKFTDDDVLAWEMSKNQTLAFRTWWAEVTEHDLYDNRIRPYFGVKALDITLGLTLLSISSISEATMDWTVEMYFHQEWHDPRLAFNASYFGGKTTLTLPHDAEDKLWTPDTSFINALRCQVPQLGSVSHLSLLRVKEDGTMFSAKRLSVTATCIMDLKMYPFDTQSCKLELSSYGHVIDDIVYDWKDDLYKSGGKEMYKNILLPDFDPQRSRFRVETKGFVAGMQCNTGLSYVVYNFALASVYSVPEMCIVFTRRSGFCTLQLFIPATAVVGASWISLWLEEETQFSDIVAIILAIIFLSYSYNTVMPKAMDIYLGACFMFAFFSLAKLAVVKYMRKKVAKRERRATLALASVDESEPLAGASHNNSVENTPEKKFSHLIRRMTVHDRYWQKMKVFHVGSQLILPLAFAVFALFFFFIYPYISTETAKCI